MKQFLEQSSRDWDIKDKEVRQLHYDTTYKTLHADPGVNPNPVGRMVLKDIDGKPVPANRRDNDLLVDLKLLPR